MEQTANNASAALGRNGNEENISRGAGPVLSAKPERYITDHCAIQGPQSQVLAQVSRKPAA